MVIDAHECIVFLNQNESEKIMQKFYEKVRLCKSCSKGFVYENELGWDVEGTFILHDDEQSDQGGQYICNGCYDDCESEINSNNNDYWGS